MRTRIAALLSVPGLAIAGLAVTATSALADTPNCVSRAEYHSIKYGA